MSIGNPWINGFDEIRGWRPLNGRPGLRIAVRLQVKYVSACLGRGL